MADNYFGGTPTDAYALPRYPGVVGDNQPETIAKGKSAWQSFVESTEFEAATQAARTIGKGIGAVSTGAFNGGAHPLKVASSLYEGLTRSYSGMRLSQITDDKEIIDAYQAQLKANEDPNTLGAEGPKYGIQPSLLSKVVGNFEKGVSTFVTRPLSTGFMLTDPDNPYRGNGRFVRDSWNRSEKVPFSRAMVANELGNYIPPAMNPTGALTSALGFDQYDIYSDESMEAADQNPYYQVVTGSIQLGTEFTPVPLAPIKGAKAALGFKRYIDDIEDLDAIRTDWERHKAWREQKNANETPVAEEPNPFINDDGTVNAQATAEALAARQDPLQQLRNAREETPQQIADSQSKYTSEVVLDDGVTPAQTPTGINIEKIARQTSADQIARNPLVKLMPAADRARLANILARTNDPDTIFEILQGMRGDIIALSRLQRSYPEVVWQLGDGDAMRTERLLNGEPYRPVGNEADKVRQTFISSNARDEYFADVRALMRGRDSEYGEWMTGMQGGSRMPTIRGKGITGGFAPMVTRVRGAVDDWVYKWQTRQFEGIEDFVTTTSTPKFPGGPVTQFVHWAGKRVPKGRVSISSTRPNDWITEFDAMMGEIPLFRPGFTGTPGVAVKVNPDNTLSYIPGSQFVALMRERLMRASGERNLYAAYRKVEEEIVYAMALTMTGNPKRAQAIVDEMKQASDEIAEAESYLQTSKGLLVEQSGPAIQYSPETLSMLAESFETIDMRKVFDLIKRFDDKSPGARKLAGAGDMVGSGIELFDRVTAFFRTNVLLRPGYIPKNSMAEPMIASMIVHGTVLPEEGFVSAARNFGLNRANNARELAYRADVAARFKAKFTGDPQTEKQLQLAFDNLVIEYRQAQAAMDEAIADLEAIKRGEVPPSMVPSIQSYAEQELVTATKKIREAEEILSDVAPGFQAITPPASIAGVRDQLGELNAILGDDVEYVYNLRREAYEIERRAQAQSNRLLDDIDAQIEAAADAADEAAAEFDMTAGLLDEVSVAASGDSYTIVTYRDGSTRVLRGDRRELFSHTYRTSEVDAAGRRAPDADTGTPFTSARDAFPDLATEEGAASYAIDSGPELSRLVRNLGPDDYITVYKAAPRNSPIQPGQFVSPFKRTYDYIADREGIVIHEKKVRVGDLYTDGNSVQEWGWSPRYQEDIAGVEYRPGNPDGPTYRTAVDRDRRGMQARRRMEEAARQLEKLREERAKLMAGGWGALDTANMPATDKARLAAIDATLNRVERFMDDSLKHMEFEARPSLVRTRDDDLDFWNPDEYPEYWPERRYILVGDVLEAQNDLLGKSDGSVQDTLRDIWNAADEGGWYPERIDYWPRDELEILARDAQVDDELLTRMDDILYDLENSDDPLFQNDFPTRDEYVENARYKVKQRLAREYPEDEIDAVFDAFNDGVAWPNQEGIAELREAYAKYQKLLDGDSLDGGAALREHHYAVVQDHLESLGYGPNDMIPVWRTGNEGVNRGVVAVTTQEGGLPRFGGELVEYRVPRDRVLFDAIESRKDVDGVDELPSGLFTSTERELGVHFHDLIPVRDYRPLLRQPVIPEEWAGWGNHTNYYTPRYAVTLEASNFERTQVLRAAFGPDDVPTGRAMGIEPTNDGILMIPDADPSVTTRKPIINDEGEINVRYLSRIPGNRITPGPGKGIDGPFDKDKAGEIVLNYDSANGRIYVAEGNHRVAAALEAGVEYLPVRINRKKTIDDDELNRVVDEGGSPGSTNTLDVPWKGGPETLTTRDVFVQPAPPFPPHIQMFPQGLADQLIMDLRLYTAAKFEDSVADVVSMTQAGLPVDQVRFAEDALHLTKAEAQVAYDTGNIGPWIDEYFKTLWDLRKQSQIKKNVPSVDYVPDIGRGYSDPQSPWWDIDPMEIKRVQGEYDTMRHNDTVIRETGTGEYVAFGDISPNMGSTPTTYSNPEAMARVREIRDELQGIYDNATREGVRPGNTAQMIRDSQKRIDELTEEMAEVEGKLAAKQSKKEKAKRFHGTGQGTITINVGGRPMTIDGFRSERPGLKGQMWADASSADETARLTYDPSGRASSAVGRAQVSGQVEIIDRYEPNYWPELAYVGQLFRDDPLLRRILTEPKAAVVAWLKTPDGRSYAKAMGKDYLGVKRKTTPAPKRPEIDPNAPAIADTTRGKPKTGRELVEESNEPIEAVDTRGGTAHVLVSEARHIDDLYNIVYSYFPTKAVRDRLASGDRGVGAAELRGMLSQEDELAVIASGRGEYADEKVIGSLLDRAMDWLWKLAQSKPETRVSRWPFMNRQLAINIERKANLLEQQGVKVTTKQLEAMRTAALREALDEMDKTYYNIRRYNQGAYSTRFLTAFPGAFFNSLYRYGRFAIVRPEETAFTGLIAGDIMRVFGTDSEGEPITQENISDTTWINLPTNKDKVIAFMSGKEDWREMDGGFRFPVQSLATLFIDYPGMSWAVSMTLGEFMKRFPEFDETTQRVMGPMYEEYYPYGPPKTPASTLFGAYQKDIWRAVDGPSNTDYALTAIQFHANNMAVWERNLETNPDAPEPRMQDAIDDAYSFHFARGVKKAFAPVTISETVPGDYMRQAWYEFKATNPGDTIEDRQKFMELHGDWARWYTYSASSYTAYLPASQDAYKLIWKDHPELVQKLVATASSDEVIGIISILTTGVDETFSTAVNNYFKNNPLPGDDEPLSSRMTVAQFDNTVQVADGWALFSRNRVKYDAEQQNFREMRDNAETKENREFWKAKLAESENNWNEWMANGPLSRNAAWQADTATKTDKRKLANAVFGEILADKDFMSTTGKSQFWQKMDEFVKLERETLAVYKTLEDKNKKEFRSRFRNYIRNEFIVDVPEFGPVFERYYGKTWDPNDESLLEDG